ncbi:type II secretion system F family protein [uncultured Friedmanniella sp.]|uniref:type II secretion system F family protein n=1 Tax=uncultured Friedmanniella sp. TaxID=335381 RepID=UPI0035CA0B8A
MIWIFTGLAAFTGLLVAGAYQFSTNAADQRTILVGALQGTLKEEAPRSRFSRMSRLFNRSRLGHSLERNLLSAGISHPPVVVFGVTLAISLVVPYVLAQLLAPAFGVLGLASGLLLLRSWLRHSRERRRERFVQQIPELARVLANATNAGLSISTAWVVAEGEMEEPARSEIQRLNAAVRFGASLEEAMLQLLDRLPAREVRVLMSTLVVSSRSGGSLIKALRDISLTLDDRKEVRREVRTTLAQARTTGTLVMVMGIGILLILNLIQPGLVDKMTRNPLGQAALVVGFALFAFGQLVVRRLTRIEA